ncbi:MAG: cell division protein FtsA [Ignavibacteria bacterium]|nr:cell division protein FtsA [Ignavibacteria bacterium]MBP7093229.1 cell division protein FtsA [Candidatus Kapabacteria bacterium]MBK6418959.1 cell division protein FtsA [Ignavibacteria bacterium]MBK6760355.1 cell division protein FtsA [Ignavibacteria bacterium]MBK7185176.1 cell division protein FtsA [Ignavibacteria bacterium]
MSTPEIHVGLDIGTTKVCAVVTAFDPVRKVVEVLGAGMAECDGLKRGVVTNINKTADAIKVAIDRAEQQSGYKLARVVIGVSGEHISTFETRGIVTTRTSEISEDDVRRLHDELAQVNVTPDRRILHVIAQDYIIDGQDGISDPLGMSGRRLEANALVITASAAAVENVYKCANRAGLHVDAVVLQSMASALAVLDDAEREVGVAVVDIGGGTTDLAIYKDNVLRSVSVIGLAGQRVTDDIVTVLGIRNNDAEQIKVDHGHAISDSILRDEHFQVPGVGGRRPSELSKTILCQVIEPRMEEIFEFVLQRIHDSGLAHQLAAGIVITGGCSDLRGADMLAQRTFRLPVNKGLPRGFSHEGLAREVTTPVHATAVGLALYSIEHEDEFEEQHSGSVINSAPVAAPTPQHQPAASVEPPSQKKGLLQNVKDWFENL